MKSHAGKEGRKSREKRHEQSAKDQKHETVDAEELYDDISGAFLMKYKINDKGIGQISLPPSLSMVLQSDQIYISPSGGGLFIRSV